MIVYFYIAASQLYTKGGTHLGDNDIGLKSFSGQSKMFVDKGGHKAV